MTNAIYYPPADRTTLWFGPGNAIIPPEKIVWHTTEGWDFTDFNGGSEAPNLTYNPWKHQWMQHFQLNGSSRALKNSPDGSYQTNRKGMCQVEIVCTDGWTPAIVAKNQAVWNLDNQALSDLNDFAHFMNSEWSVPLTTSVEWPSFSSPAPARLTPDELVNYKGHLGHMHIPYNDHGDPCNLNIAAILNSPANVVPTKKRNTEMTVITDGAGFALVCGNKVIALQDTASVSSAKDAGIPVVQLAQKDYDSVFARLAQNG